MISAYQYDSASPYDYSPDQVHDTLLAELSPEEQVAYYIGKGKSGKGRKGGRGASPGANPFNKETGERMRCFLCGSPDHLQKDCPKNRWGNLLREFGNWQFHRNETGIDECLKFNTDGYGTSVDAEASCDRVGTG